MALTRRGRRWLIALSGLTVTLLVCAGWINRQLEPHRLTTLVLGRLGNSLQLELNYSGDPDYAFKPEPRLVLPNLIVRDPRNRKIFLSAKRVEISLPWATLTGGDPIITRIDLDQPILNLSGLRHWQSTRPKTPFQLPTLTKGLSVSQGTVLDETFLLQQVELNLPHLQPGDTARVTLAGVFEKNQTRVKFNTVITTPTPGLESDFTLAGSGEWQHVPKPLPFKLSLNGHYRFDNVGFSANAPLLQLEAASPLPSFVAKAHLALAQQMQLAFDGTLRHWPKDWPALPEPFASSNAPIIFQLDYLGKNDFSGPLNLILMQADTQLQATLRIDEVQRWIAQPNASPLLPLNAKMYSPQLSIGTMVLDKVEIEIHDDESEH